MQKIITCQVAEQDEQGSSHAHPPADPESGSRSSRQEAPPRLELVPAPRHKEAGKLPDQPEELDEGRKGLEEHAVETRQGDEQGCNGLPLKCPNHADPARSSDSSSPARPPADPESGSRSSRQQAPPRLELVPAPRHKEAGKRLDQPEELDEGREGLEEHAVETRQGDEQGCKGLLLECLNHADPARSSDSSSPVHPSADAESGSRSSRQRAPSCLELVRVPWHKEAEESPVGSDEGPFRHKRQAKKPRKPCKGRTVCWKPLHELPAEEECQICGAKGSQLLQGKPDKPKNMYFLEEADAAELQGQWPFRCWCWKCEVARTAIGDGSEDHTENEELALRCGRCQMDGSLGLSKRVYDHFRRAIGDAPVHCKKAGRGHEKHSPSIATDMRALTRLTRRLWANVPALVSVSTCIPRLGLGEVPGKAVPCSAGVGFRAMPRPVPLSCPQPPCPC